MMNEEKIMDFQVKLAQIKEEILLNTSIISQVLETNKDDVLDETDLASADIAQGMEMRLGNRKTLYLKKVDKALARIEKGEFGECLDCGEDINIRRLEVRPTAELCINCKEEAEKSELSKADGKKHKSQGKTVRLRAL